MSPSSELKRLRDDLVRSYPAYVIDGVCELRSSEKEAQRRERLLVGPRNALGKLMMLVGVLAIAGGIVHAMLGMGGLSSVGQPWAYVVGGAVIGLVGQQMAYWANQPTAAQQEDAARLSLARLHRWHERQLAGGIVMPLLDAVIDGKQRAMEDTAAREYHLGVLRDAVELVVAAVRVLRPDADNTAMLSTIDGELKTILHEPARLPVLRSDPELLAELEMARGVFQSAGVSDPFIARRFGIIFGDGEVSSPAPAD